MNAIVIGAGIGGLSAALELSRRGFAVTVLERLESLGGKASERRWRGWRWDEGPSIVVMPWVYRELFAASGLDPDAFLPMKRLDPAFRIVLADGRRFDLPAAIEGVRDEIARIEPADAAGLDRFLTKIDAFAAKLGHAYCDRIIESWMQVLLSPLMTSASIIPPTRPYAEEINQHFRSPMLRELFYGFPTFSGFDPRKAPASLAVMPWLILREGVWYPERGGVAAIPKALAQACFEVGVEVRTGVEVEAIERDSRGAVIGVSTSSGPIAAPIVVSNADYAHTFALLREHRKDSSEARKVRQGQAEPSTSFLTIQIAAERSWDLLAHHLLVMTPGAGRVYDEVYNEKRFPSDPPLYVNVTSVTDAEDAPEGGSNPFIVINAPAVPEGMTLNRDRQGQYADFLIQRLEQAGLDGLRAATAQRQIFAPEDWRDRFRAYRGSIHGLGASHNILGGGFRPKPFLAEAPGLYFVGGGVQPGPGMPMVVQSGKIVAARIDRDFPARRG